MYKAKLSSLKIDPHVIDYIRWEVIEIKSGSRVHGVTSSYVGKDTQLFHGVRVIVFICILPEIVAYHIYTINGEFSKNMFLFFWLGVIESGSTEVEHLGEFTLRYFAAHIYRPLDNYCLVSDVNIIAQRE